MMYDLLQSAECLYGIGHLSSAIEVVPPVRVVFVGLTSVTIPMIDPFTPTRSALRGRYESP